MGDQIGRRPGATRPSPTATTSSGNTPATSGTAATDGAAPVPGTPTSATDSFGNVPGTPQGSSAGSSTLPDVLLDVGGTRVVHGDDPGDFYCEHMFFTAQQAAETSPTVAKNAQGERLVGFLHVPWDGHTSKTFTDGAYTQAHRHQNSRQVIGAALRGYFDAARTQVTSGPVNMLLTGYGPFSSARDNPTGDFVKHPENLDAAMKHAFGDALLTPTGTARTDPGIPADTTRRVYQVRDKATGQTRDIVVQLQWFPVTDDAIDGTGARSIQKSMAQFGAHAVLSMGVHSGKDYLAEHHADDGGLTERGGRLVHDYSAQPRTNLADNFALPRAIYEGDKLRRSSTPLGVRTGPR